MRVHGRGALVVAGLALSGCEGERVEAVAARVDAVDARLDTIDGRIAELDGRLARLEASAPAASGGSPTLDERIAGLELRLAAIEGAGGAKTAPDPVTTVTRPDGRVVPKPTVESSRKCAYDVATAIATAELSYDAAFDGFSDSLHTIGYSIDGSGGCDLLLGGRIGVTPEDFKVTVVVKEGPARGTAFTVDKSGQVAQLPRLLDAAGLRAMLTGKGCFGCY